MYSLNKMTRYALYAVMEMARAGEDLVTVGEIAERYSVSEGALARVFQDLSRDGWAVGVRGAGGGYRLAKDPAEVTVLDVLAQHEPLREKGHCLLQEADRPCDLRSHCRLGSLFDEVDELVRERLGAVTIEELAAPEHSPA